MKPRVMILLGAVGLVVGGSVLIGQALAQQGGEIKTEPPNREVLCPHPGSLTIQATATPSVNQADFNPLPQGQGVGVLNASQTDHVFRYTFNWKVSDKLCCEITKATLTVRLRWNGPAGPSTASNDTISIMSGTASVAGVGGYIWGPSPPNSTSTTPHTGSLPPNPLTKTIIINMNPLALMHANTDHRLSFQVQDDTTVESAVLQINGCCVNHYK